ncbi:glycosyltransferase [Curtobacterium sp. P97]|uniref:glycosyltransferase n=1 Tax=Curtobacterium sp. P97 TaxID=2939562 RepID=UPI00204100DE|nr:glycosyltransferase [Curtobacterium sp. P97]MCM3521964.1 glycosyltransferase [Curtobacterium sp. P97]
MSVTYISADGAFGGPVSVALNQAAGLVEAGHDVTLLAGWDGLEPPTVPGVELILLRAKPLLRAGFVVTATWGLRKWLRRNIHRFDLVHVHSGRHLFDVIVANAAVKSSAPTMLQPHGMIAPSSRVAVRAVDRLIILPLLRRASAILALTMDEESGLRELVPLQLISRIRNGIRSGSVAAKRVNNEVLFLARLHPRKRVLAFAEAAKAIQETSPEATFAVVGPDEGDLVRLKAFMSANPDVRLRYEGVIAPGSAAARLAQATVFVLPSRGEVFPVTVLEALSVGTPTVITADCGIAGELAESGAAKVTDGTSQDLAAIIEALLRDKAAREALSHAALKATDQLYSNAAVTRALIETYNEATMRGRRRIPYGDARDLEHRS